VDGCCVQLFQSLDPEIEARIKARYRDKFKLDSDKTSQQQVKPAISLTDLPLY